MNSTLQFPKHTFSSKYQPIVSPVVVIAACPVDSYPVPVSAASCRWSPEAWCTWTVTAPPICPSFNSTENFLSLSNSRVFQPHFGRSSKTFPLPTSTPNNLRLPPPQDAASRDSGPSPGYHESVIPPLARPSPDSRAGTSKERQVGARLAVRRAIISHMVRISPPTLRLPAPALSVHHYDDTIECLLFQLNRP